ncbi:unnamed protein product, partial [Symbiodinium microadriaticum]
KWSDAMPRKCARRGRQSTGCVRPHRNGTRLQKLQRRPGQRSARRRRHRCGALPRPGASRRSSRS